MAALLSLPEDLRDAFKEPFGPVYTDAEALVAAAGRPLIAVGDVVTYHLLSVGHEPRVAVVDGRTEREAVDEAVRAVVDTASEDPIEVGNEPGTLSRELLVALREAVAGADPTVIAVEGEEDLATLPAVLVTPLGGSVVYGQPGEGMVLVAVTEDARAEMRDLLGELDGDVGAALDVLGVDQ